MIGNSEIVSCSTFSSRGKDCCYSGALEVQVKVQNLTESISFFKYFINSLHESVPMVLESEFYDILSDSLLLELFPILLLTVSYINTKILTRFSK